MAIGTSMSAMEPTSITDIAVLPQDIAAQISGTVIVYRDGKLTLAVSSFMAV